MRLPPSIYIQVFAHALVEWGVAFALAMWVAQVWSREPAPFPVWMARHRARTWFMIAFGVTPPIIAAVLRGLLAAMYARSNGPAIALPISYLLSALFGFLTGVAAVCCTAPASAQRSFRPQPAAGLSAALVVAPLSVGTLLGFHLAVYMTAEIIFPILILAVARPFFGASDFPARDPAMPPAPRNLAPALILGFAPSALLLIALAVGSAAQFSREASTALLWFCSVISVFCCFAASFMLFSRKTGGALAGGIALLLVNAFIAFFFGCCASFQF